MIEKAADSNEKYHANPLLGTSTMVSGYDSKTGKINLAKVQAMIEGSKSISKSLQKTFDFGSVQHSVILEQDLSQVLVVPKFEAVPALTKKAQDEEWVRKFGTEEDGTINYDKKKMPKFKPLPGVTLKAQVEEFKQNNKALYYISEKEFASISGAFEVLASHSAAADVISRGFDIEVSFYDEKEGIKCRPDIVGKTQKGDLYICNYKTIADLSKCDSHTYSLKYDIRAMQEIDIIERHYKTKVQHYFFLFQEKIPPYSMRLIEIGDIDREIAWDEYKKCKNTVISAKKEEYWPQPSLLVEESKIYRSPQITTF